VCALHSDRGFNKRISYPSEHTQKGVDKLKLVSTSPSAGVMVITTKGQRSSLAHVKNLRKHGWREHWFF